MAPTLLQIVGLCLQMLGAFFIAKSIIWKAPRYLMRELIDMPVDRYRTFRHYLAGRVEAIFGFVFLAVGAGLQLAGVVRQAGPEHSTGLLFWVLLSLGSTAAIAGLLYVVIKRIAKRLFLDLFVEQVKRRNWPFQEDTELLRELGDMLEIPRTEDDTIDTYQDKVRDALGLPPRRPKPRRRQPLKR